jgi:hypothetical protein
MKRFATIVLMLNIGAAGIYATQTSVNMTFSGTSVPTPANLQSGANSGEDDFAGSGSLGQFTYRDLTAGSAPQTSSTCSGPNKIYTVRVAGAGVFRFADGSLLMVTLKQGSDCIDLAAQQAHCTWVFQISGGTGRFANASGIITLTKTTVPVLADATHNPVFFANTGTFTGMISGVTGGDQQGDDRHD